MNRLLIASYAPVVRGVLRFRKTTIALAVVALILTYPAFAGSARNSCRRSTRE